MRTDVEYNKIQVMAIRPEAFVPSLRPSTVAFMQKAL